MKQEDKDLLLKDLCARLPYGVKCDIEFDDGAVFPKRILMPIMIRDFTKFEYVKIIKPYLFPLSSMTEKQEYEYREVIASTFNHYEVYDWLNKNHFDYRGLIPMGLANNATNLNIY